MKKYLQRLLIAIESIAESLKEEREMNRLIQQVYFLEKEIVRKDFEYQNIKLRLTEGNKLKVTEKKTANKKTK